MFVCVCVCIESADDDALGLRKERLRKSIPDGPDGHRRSSLEGYKYSPPSERYSHMTLT